MRTLAAKIVLLLTLLGGAHALASYYVVHYARLDPRTALFHADELDRYSYFLLGDSVFCSFYVDNAAQTLWQQLAQKTGQEVFPAALNGADTRDFADQARYLAAVAPKGSTVFVNLLPTRDYAEQERRFKNSFDLLLGKQRDLLEGKPYYAEYSAINIALYKNILGLYDKNMFNSPLKSLFHTAQYYAVKENRNRTWDRAGDYALKRYQKFMENLQEKRAQPRFDYSMIGKIRDILRRGGLNGVFVITPVNEELIRHGSAARVTEIQSYFASRRTELRRYLEEQQLDYIDLTGSVTGNGFADLFHTNAAGDERMAEALARYLQSAASTGGAAAKPKGPSPAGKESVWMTGK